MNISIEQHRAVCGSYNMNKSLRSSTNKFCLLNRAGSKALAALLAGLDILKLLLLVILNFLVTNSVFTIKDLVCFPIMGYLGWCFDFFGDFLDQETCSRDAVILLLSSDAVKFGSFSILRWARILCNRSNLNLWKGLILIYCHKNAEWLYICSDVEQNPGETDDNLKIMHWNPNSIATENFSKVAVIQAHNAIHDCHIISITESALRENVSDESIDIPGYVPVRNDLPPDDRNGGVLIWHKADLAVINRPDIFDHINTIVLQISVAGKKIFYILVYRRFGQSVDEFDNFCTKFDEALTKIEAENPYCIAAGGDYNAHLKEWYAEGVTDSKGVHIQKIFLDHGMTQLVDQPTYIGNETKTCVDLFAIDQPNLVLANEVLPSLIPECHHQINFTKLSLKCPPPLPLTLGRPRFCF
jgi:hypothetical protein